MAQKTPLHIVLLSLLVLLAVFVAYLLMRGQSPQNVVGVDAGQTQRGRTAEVTGQITSTQRDLQRKKDINALLNTLTRYRIDHEMKYPEGLTKGKVVEICRNTEANCSGMLDLSKAIVGVYLAKIPVDPGVKSGNGTRYFVEVTSADELVITAPDAEEGTLSARR